MFYHITSCLVQRYESAVRVDLVLTLRHVVRAVEYLYQPVKEAGASPQESLRIYPLGMRHGDVTSHVLARIHRVSKTVLGHEILVQDLREFHHGIRTVTLGEDVLQVFAGARWNRDDPLFHSRTLRVVDLKQVVTRVAVAGVHVVPDALKALVQPVIEHLPVFVGEREHHRPGDDLFRVGDL